MIKKLGSNRNLLINIVLLIVIGALAIFIYLRRDQILAHFHNASDEVETVQNTEAEGSEVDEPDSDQQQEQKIAVPALPFTLEDIHDERVSLGDFEGTPVMVNFWATWCPPCKAEMPIIQDHAERNQGELIVLAINAGEEKSVVKDFVEMNGFNDLRFLIDPENSVASLYRVPGFPTSLFIDSEGLMQAVHIGELNDPLLEQYLGEIGVGQ